MFVTIAAMTLIVAGVLGSCDKLDLAQNTNASPESNSGTQTWAASALKTPTRPPSTNTPTPSPTPTETPTVTPTQTPSPTPTPEIPFLIAQFGLNPERQYTFVITENGTRYLRDEHNQALMLRYEVVEEAGQQLGIWVDTSLEEKYGHLVPVTETRRSYRELGYSDVDGINNSGNRDYQNLILLVRNTGNLRVETVFDPNLNQGITRLIGPAVYRALDGSLHQLNLVYAATNAAYPLFLPRVCVIPPDDSLESILATLEMCRNMGGLELTPDQALASVMNIPGQPLRVTITYARPDTPPAFFISPRNPDYTNLYSIYNWYLRDANPGQWEQIADSIQRTGVNPDPDALLGVTNFCLYMPEADFTNLWLIYPPIDP